MFTSKQVVTNRGKAGGVNIVNVTGYTISLKKTFPAALLFLIRPSDLDRLAY